jgi:hypothetical protein
MSDLTSDCLVAIESKCDWLQYDAKELLRFASMLKNRRDFLTKAEDGLNKAEQSLKEALRAVHQARKQYLAKTPA